MLGQPEAEGPGARSEDEDNGDIDDDDDVAVFTALCGRVLWLWSSLFPL